jgi:hypothetical protein
MLEEAGLYRRTNDNKTEYDQFTGALSDWLESHHDLTGKAPTDKEIIEAGEKLLYKPPAKGWFGWPTTGTPLYKEESPQEYKDIARKPYLDRNMTPPSDETIDRQYRRQRLEELERIRHKGEPGVRDRR